MYMYTCIHVHYGFMPNNKDTVPIHVHVYIHIHVHVHQYQLN